MSTVRAELSWLRSGPLSRVHLGARAELDSALVRWGHLRLDLDGRAMTSRSGCHAELARAFGFPEYYGANWDAFDECAEDFLAEHRGVAVAVVWHHVDEAARAAPASTAEVGWVLLSLASSAADAGEVLEVFAVGNGDDFDRP